MFSGYSGCPRVLRRVTTRGFLAGQGIPVTLYNEIVVNRFVVCKSLCNDVFRLSTTRQRTIDIRVAACLVCLNYCPATAASKRVLCFHIHKIFSCVIIS